MGEKYYFCNSRFKAQIQDGTIRSVSMMGDGDNIPYLNEEKGYGNLYLTWEKGGERKQWQPLGDQGFADSAPVARGRSVRYEGGIQGEELKVTVRFRLGEALVLLLVRCQGNPGITVFTNEENRAEVQGVIGQSVGISNIQAVHVLRNIG